MKKVFRNVIIVTAVVLVARYFWKKRKTSKNTLQYSKPPVLENDDRETFKGNNPIDYIRGYSMPSLLTDLIPNTNGQIFIATKPNTNVFGQEPRSAIFLLVDVPNNELIYEGSMDGQTKEISLKYDNVKDSLVLMDKKYLKTKQN